MKGLILATALVSLAFVGGWVALVHWKENGADIQRQNSSTNHQSIMQKLENVFGDDFRDSSKDEGHRNFLTRARDNPIGINGNNKEERREKRNCNRENGGFGLPWGLGGSTDGYGSNFANLLGLSYLLSPPAVPTAVAASQPHRVVYIEGTTTAKPYTWHPKHPTTTPEYIYYEEPEKTIVPDEEYDYEFNVDKGSRVEDTADGIGVHEPYNLEPRFLRQLRKPKSAVLHRTDPNEGAKIVKITNYGISIIARNKKKALIKKSRDEPTEPIDEHHGKENGAQQQQRHQLQLRRNSIQLMTNPFGLPLLQLDPETNEKYISVIRKLAPQFAVSEALKKSAQIALTSEFPNGRKVAENHPAIATTVRKSAVATGRNLAGILPSEHHGGQEGEEEEEVQDLHGESKAEEEAVAAVEGKEAVVNGGEGEEVDEEAVYIEFPKTRKEAANLMHFLRMNLGLAAIRGEEDDNSPTAFESSEQNAHPEQNHKHIRNHKSSKTDQRKKSSSVSSASRRKQQKSRRRHHSDGTKLINGSNQQRPSSKRRKLHLDTLEFWEKFANKMSEWPEFDAKLVVGQKCTNTTECTSHAHCSYTYAESGDYRCQCMTPRIEKRGQCVINA